MVLGAGQGLGDALPGRGAVGKPGLLQGAWMEAERDGVARIRRADRCRARPGTSLLPFCFAAPYRAPAVGFASVGDGGRGVLTACGQGGCLLPLSSPALFFSFRLSSYCSTRSMISLLGMPSVKPQALHGHGPCLHVSFHVPVALPSILNLSSCNPLAGRERRGEVLHAGQRGAVGD